MIFSMNALRSYWIDMLDWFAYVKEEIQNSDKNTVGWEFDEQTGSIPALSKPSTSKPRTVAARKIYQEMYDKVRESVRRK